MHTSSNFVVILNGEKEEIIPIQKHLQEFVDINILEDNRFSVEETYEVVRLEDIIDLFAETIRLSPNVELIVVGYIDCTENSGEIMDFAMVYKNLKLKTYSSDWKYANYDDDEIYQMFDMYACNEELDDEPDFKEIISEINNIGWCDKDTIPIKSF